MATTPSSIRDWRPDLYARHAAFVPTLARDLLDWLAPEPGMRVLDLGCGDGVLTRAIIDRGAEVVGVDGSRAMVAAAVRRGVDARVGRAEGLEFDAEFDAAFSNAMLHWTQDIHATLTGVRRALRPGGRFVGEFGGQGNIASCLAAARAELTARAIPLRHDPWYFPSADEFASELARAGFDIDAIQLFDRPTPLPSGVVEWLEIFGGPLLGLVPASDRREIAQAIEARLAPTARAADGTWTMDYVRLRFVGRRGLGADLKVPPSVPPPTAVSRSRQPNR